jgi:hypothetical protein
MLLMTWVEKSGSLFLFEMDKVSLYFCIRGLGSIEMDSLISVSVHMGKGSFC